MLLLLETGNICLSDISKENRHVYIIHPTSELMQYISFEPYDNLNELREHEDKNKGRMKGEMYQCIIHNNYPGLVKCVANRPNGDFATKDLFVKQKQSIDGSCYWNFVCRIDDAFNT